MLSSAVALFATGVAAMALCHRARPAIAVAVGAGTVAAWAVAAVAIGGDGPVAHAARAWRSDAWWVAIGACVVAVSAAER